MNINLFNIDINFTIKIIYKKKQTLAFPKVKCQQASPIDVNKKWKQKWLKIFKKSSSP